MRNFLMAALLSWFVPCVVVAQPMPFRVSLRDVPADQGGVLRASWRDISALPFESDANTVALYHMDTQSDSMLVDSSGLGNDGRIRGAAWVPDGAIAGALQLDGVNDYFIAPSPEDLGLTNGYSIELWAKPFGYYQSPGTGNATFILSASDEQFEFHMTQRNGTDGTIFIPATRQYSITGGPLGIMAWSYILVSVDTLGVARIYLDGVLQTEIAGITIPSDSKALHFGVRASGRETYGWFHGIIDEVRISNVARTPSSVAGVPVSVMSYEIQKFDDAWSSIAPVAVTEADSYFVEVATTDIASLADPAPYSLYRVIARTASEEVLYVSAVDSAYSIDNLPPAPPQLTVYDTENSRVLAWMSDSVQDNFETCLYRDLYPSFAAGDPVNCSGDQNFFVETHLARYFYRARSFDIHGNASDWSTEVTGRWPTPVPGLISEDLRLYPCQPNPFNPRTTIKFDLPAAGAVRLAVFDLAGRLMRTLVGEDMSPGSHEVLWDGRDVAGREVGSGTYLARLEFDGKVQTIRMGLIR